jgi:hypothetical protein
MKFINITTLLLAFSSVINGSGLNIIINTDDEISGLSNTKPQLAENLCTEAAYAMITGIKNFFGVKHVSQLITGDDFKCDVFISKTMKKQSR